MPIVGWPWKLNSHGVIEGQSGIFYKKIQNCAIFKLKPRNFTELCKFDPWMILHGHIFDQGQRSRSNLKKGNMLLGPPEPLIISVGKQKGHQKMQNYAVF